MKTCFPIVSPEVKAKIMAMGGDFASNLTLLGELGFEGIELMVKDAVAISRPDLKSCLKKNNLVIHAIGATPVVSEDKLTLASPKADVRERALQRACELIDLAAEFNAPFCIGSFRGSIDDTPGNGRADALNAFKALGQYAKERNVNVLIEPQSPSNGNYLNTVGEVIEWIKSIGTNNFKLILDLFHMDACEKSIFGALRKAEGHVGLVHLCDSKRRVMGFGSFPVCDFISSILASGYEGAFSVEVKQEPDHATTAKMSAQFFKYFNNIFM